MIDHRRDSRRLPRPLYLMAKPEAGVRDHIHGLARTQRSRPAGLLHVTLLTLIDLAVAPMALEAVLAAMAGFRGEEVRILFDRIVERRCVVLRGGRGTDAARGLQAARGISSRTAFPFSDRRQRRI